MDVAREHFGQVLVTDVLPFDKPAARTRTLNSGAESFGDERFMESGLEVVQLTELSSRDPQEGRWAGIRLTRVPACISWRLASRS